MDFRKFLSSDPEYPATRALRLIHLLPAHSVFKAKLAEKVKHDPEFKAAATTELDLWEKVRGRTPTVVYLDSIFSLIQAVGGAKKIMDHPMSPGSAKTRGTPLIQD